jgi:hypothetical protein
MAPALRRRRGTTGKSSGRACSRPILGGVLLVICGLGVGLLMGILILGTPSSSTENTSKVSVGGLLRKPNMERVQQMQHDISNLYHEKMHNSNPNAPPVVANPVANPAVANAVHTAKEEEEEEDDAFPLHREQHPHHKPKQKLPTLPKRPATLPNPNPDDSSASVQAFLQRIPQMGTSSQSCPHVPHDLVSLTHDFTTFQALGGHRMEEYKHGDSPYSNAEGASDDLARSRRVHVQKAMQHTWSNYAKYCFGQDEMLPKTHTGSNNWGGMGTTLVDSLDTLWLMNLKDEFWQARDWVRDNLNHNKNTQVSVFETTIRSLGGLLSAYDWSGDDVFLVQAADLGKRLFQAFDTASGIPYGQVNLHSSDNGGGGGSNIGWTGGNAITAEAGTLQIEFRMLARLTGVLDYKTKSEHVHDILKKMHPPNALYPYFIRNRGPTPEFANNKLTFGAMGDSLYEYMLKIWIQGGQVETKYRDMYDESIQGMYDQLLQLSTPSGLVFIADRNNGKLDTKMDHLVCFMGGLLALGAYTDPRGLDSPRAQRDLKTGKALTYTCYQMYARMKTGIAAEYVQFYPGRDFDVGRGAPHYLLRPETVESFFVLYQLTKDPIYREWGWEVFQAIEKYCKTEFGYGSLKNVQDTSAEPQNKMESFFLAETLKYLYLLFDPDTEVDILHTHVFNTEAHPVRTFRAMDAAGVVNKLQ